MSIFDKLRHGVVTTSASETHALARELAPELPRDCVLALHGNLGVGKTTFVQGLARGFGIQESVTSPTFNIFTLHRGPQRTLVHLDAYRLTAAKQVEDLMLDDFLTSPFCLAVEWPEKIADWLPADAIRLSLSIVDGDRHRVQLTDTSA